MTNEEKAVGLSLQIRDLCIEKGVTKDNAETASLLVQQAALQMAQWKDEQFAKKIEQIKENIILARDNKEYYKARPEVALDWVLRLIDEINKDN